MIVGTQVLALGLCAHAYGTYFMGEQDPWFDRMRARFRLEHGLLLGGAFMLIGVAMGAVIVATWIVARLRLARRRTPRGDRRLAADRRHPDLLLVVPALDPRPAPALACAYACVLGVALLLALGALVLDMSGRAPRIAGSDHASPVVLRRDRCPVVGRSASRVDPLPEDAARVQILIGTLRSPGSANCACAFSTRRARASPRALAAAGAHEGDVTIPLADRPGRAPADGRVPARRRILARSRLGGEGGADQPRLGASSTASRRPGGSACSICAAAMNRGGSCCRRSHARFGLGKASFFGDWTLPVAALLLLGVWVAIVRLLRGS